MRYLTFIGIGIGVMTILSLCTNQSSSKKATDSSVKYFESEVVTLKIDSSTSKSSFADLFFYYHDSLYQSHGIGMSVGKVTFSINASVILIDAVNNQTPYLINPGENIHIKNVGTDSIGMYIPEDKVRTNELNFFRDLTKTTGQIWYFVPMMPYHAEVKNLKEMHSSEKIINDVKNDRLRFLKSYSQEFKVSSNFINAAGNCIKITAISDSLYLYRRNRMMLIKGMLYKTLIVGKISSIRQVGFMPNQFYYRACSDLVDIIGKMGDQGTEFNKSFDFINRNFDGLTKDYLLARAVYSDFKSNVPISNEELRKFNAECRSAEYRDQINRILKANSVAFAYAKNSNKLLSLDGKTVQDLNAVIAKYKGKLVLFDFWASWCPPCRKEMPYTALLKKDYKNRNIVFVTISTDGNVTDWKNAAKDEGLVSKNDYLLLNADQASFIKKYNVNAIPRYMLLGKDGKIVNENAPRPSDQKLKTLINSLL